jgi:hypothetical protein
MSGIFVVILLGGVVAWVLTRGTRRASDADDIEPVDRDELEAAEREVRDLDVHQRPEDGFEGDDWGPGAGRKK